MDGNRVRFLVVYGVLGSRPLERFLCFLAKYLKVDAVVLLGDIVSPLIVRRLVHECGVRTLGVLGVLDNPSVSQALRSVNGLLDCHRVNVKGVDIFGVGISACSGRDYGKVDVLASSRPGVKTTCCDRCSDIVDELVDILSPRIVLVGGCTHPCIRGNVASPGSLKIGFFGLLDVDSQFHVFKFYQADIYELLLVEKAGTII